MITTAKYRYPALVFGAITLFILYNWCQSAFPTIRISIDGSGVSRQTLWDEIHRAFETHEPTPLDHVNWTTPWPTMPQYQMDKTFDQKEVEKLSPYLSLEKIEEMKLRMRSLREVMPKWETYKGIYKGRGYVMTTGGLWLDRVFPVGVQMLHRLGSTLPIEIWTKDEREYDNTVLVVNQLVKDFGIKITCYKFSDYLDVTQFPDGYVQNYLMKALTILMSSFSEVISLDADNVPVLLPDPLFKSKEYKNTGLILWPDFWSNSASSVLHTILDFPYTFHRTCESGQVVVDKNVHFESLLLAAYYNWYGARFYNLLTLDGMGTGDKDTFVLGAQTLGLPFHFVERPLELLRAVHTDGRQWRNDTSVFNGAMGQFSPLGPSAGGREEKRIMFMHMHAPKLNFQHQENVGADLVFVRSDSKGVEFWPSSGALEGLLWESVVWVECDSLLKVQDDKRRICEGAKTRLQDIKAGNQ